MAHVLAIDPGLHLGWAMFKHTPHRFHPPLSCGEFHRKRNRGLDWRTAATSVLVALDEMLGRHRNLSVVVEWPFIAPGTEAKGEDVLKIQYMVGWIAATCHRERHDFYPVPVRDWKGQLSKEMTHRRIRTFLDSLSVPWEEPESGHTLDAIGIGSWWLGANFGAGRSPIARQNAPRRSS